MCQFFWFDIYVSTPICQMRDQDSYNFLTLIPPYPLYTVLHPLQKYAIPQLTIDNCFCSLVLSAFTDTTGHLYVIQSMSDVRSDIVV